MKVNTLNGVKIYDLSAGKSLPEYMEEAKKRKIKLKNLEEYRNRIDLIQDLEFRVVANRIRISPDQNYIVSLGGYPPRIKIFETRELAMNVERRIVAEVFRCKFYQKITNNLLSFVMTIFLSCTHSMEDIIK